MLRLAKLYYDSIFSDLKFHNSEKNKKPTVPQSFCRSPPTKTIKIVDNDLQFYSALFSSNDRANDRPAGFVMNRAPTVRERACDEVAPHDGYSLCRRPQADAWGTVALGTEPRTFNRLSAAMGENLPYNSTTVLNSQARLRHSSSRRDGVL